ncbi:DUF2190 family protein [Humidesulfovibrio idahonensis]
MPYTDDPRKTFIVGGADIPAYRLCKLAAGLLVVMTATATDRPVGATRELIQAGEPGCVKMMTSDGTMEMEAATAITAGSDVYAAADGKVQALPTAAGTYRRIGTALEGASAAGAIIEVLPDDFNSAKTVSA